MRSVAFWSSLVLTWSLLFARLAEARPIETEPSSFGHFELELVDATASRACEAFFISTTGYRSFLFPVPDCQSGGVGPGTAAALDSVGDTALPAMVGGSEFHLLEVVLPTGRDTKDLFVVVATRTGAYSTKLLARHLTVARRVASSNSMVFEQSPTQAAHGFREKVRFGDVKRDTLPPAPLRVVSRRRSTLEGNLQAPSERTRFRAVLKTADQELPVDEQGSCKLAGYWDSAARVRMKAEITSYSDGHATVRCVSVGPGAN